MTACAPFRILLALAVLLVPVGEHPCRADPPSPTDSLFDPNPSAPPPPNAPDLVLRWGGRAVRGTITEANPAALRIKVPIIPGAPPAILSIPRDDIQRVHFGGREHELALLAAPDTPVETLRTLWLESRSLLDIENSHAGSFGIALADRLAEKNAPLLLREALDAYTKIRKVDWNPHRRSQAQCGRLRCMLRLGRADEAVAEAESLLQEAGDPDVLVEAHLVLGEAALDDLRALVEENPRWMEDEWVRPERNRLYHEALDQLLYPFLFHGADAASAARGLHNTLALYRFTGETQRARAIASDLASLYPDTTEADDANAYLDTLEPAKTSPPREPSTPPEDNPA